MRKPDFQVMVLGTGSHAGKSLVATALCRLLSDRGVKTAPFKAQNMALNSGVTLDGAEIGRAQILQAEAARCLPSADMNPVLLKPVRGKGSQVIVQGRARGLFSTRAFFRFWPRAAKAARESYEALALEYEALVIEGAGSPAEINLAHRDLANIETARFSRAPWILVADVERGGSFAAVLGTLQLVPTWMRPRLAGVVFNKFRGDASLMEPGLDWLRRKHGVRTLGVLPWMEGLTLDQEDSLGLPASSLLVPKARARALQVEVLLPPSVANFSDCEALRADPQIALTFRRPGDAQAHGGRPDLLLIPGSKHTLEDMALLQRSGESARIRNLAAHGTWVLGVCGGLQMLGSQLSDPLGVDGKKTRTLKGLGLLAASTRMGSLKVTRQTRTRVRTPFGHFDLKGYEIHHGRTRLQSPGVECSIDAVADSPLLCRDPSGKVWGSYLHGLLDNDAFRRALLLAVARDRGKAYKPAARAAASVSRKEWMLARWAAHVESHLRLSAIKGFLG